MVQISDFQARQASLLDTLGEVVRVETPSHDKAAVDTLVQYLRTRCHRLGGDIEAYPQSEYGDLTVATWRGDATRKPLLVMTHIDTVWPVGTIERIPFQIEDGMVRGPGVYDMKASLAMMLEAIAYIREQGFAHRTIHWLINTEEEVGSPVSRPLIEDMAGECQYVLCLEPPIPPDAALKTSRKGVGRFDMMIRGRAAHAGADPEKGISAIQELANQIQYLHSLSDFETGTTVNVGVVAGGTRSNVIAAEAQAAIDLRVVTAEEEGRVVRAILETQPRLPGTEVIVTGGMNRPPMERTEAVATAFARVREIGGRLGIDLKEGSTGGGSDGNFTAGAGVPTIDGLGCPGDGAHAAHEHIRIDGMVERGALLAALLTEL